MFHGFTGYIKSWIPERLKLLKVHVFILCKITFTVIWTLRFSYCQVQRIEMDALTLLLWKQSYQGYDSITIKFKTKNNILYSYWQTGP